jgi:hypothetical protein
MLRCERVLCPPENPEPAVGVAEATAGAQPEEAGARGSSVRKILFWVKLVCPLPSTALPLLDLLAVSGVLLFAVLFGRKDAG